MDPAPDPATAPHVVVGYDGSDPSIAALDWAAAHAKRIDADVEVVESCREPLYDGRSWAEVWDDPYAARTRAEAALQVALDDAGKRHPEIGWSGRVETGPPADVLIAAAEQADVLVVGHRGRGGFASMLLGSTARKVAGRAPSTVVIVRGPAHGDGPVVVGVDGSDPSRIALAWAAGEAQRRNVRLHVVLAWSYLLPEGEHGPVPFTIDYSADEAQRTLDAICADVLGDDPKLDVRREATCELAAKALLERSVVASLLVVGPDRSSMRHRADLGSVTAQLLHHVRCPLAVVRASTDAGPT